MPNPPAKSLEIILCDGTPILIRLVVPEDKPLFIEGFAHLSEQSRYLRFMRSMRELPDTDLTYLTEIDYVTHMAWGALQQIPAGDQGVGVARYTRLEETPQVAEAAVTVVDEYQHRGVGTILLTQTPAK